MTRCGAGRAAPLADSVDRVRLWSQVTTGLELEGDVPRSLSLDDWERRREQLRGAPLRALP